MDLIIACLNTVVRLWLGDGGRGMSPLSTRHAELFKKKQKKKRDGEKDLLHTTGPAHSKPRPQTPLDSLTPPKRVSHTSFFEKGKSVKKRIPAQKPS